MTRTPLLTVRHHDRTCDSFVPMPIGELAKWTIVETNWDGLRRVRWVPPSERFGDARQGQDGAQGRERIEEMVG
jgi:hypothetical protein